MLQTAFWPSCMNWASVFEWHKRFKEGRESVRDDERCGRSKEVRTRELIGQIMNFMDKDRHVSIETVWCQCGNCRHNYLRGTKDVEDDLRWKLNLLLWPRDQETEFPVEACWLSQTWEGQTEQIHPETFDDHFFWQHRHDLHALGSHWADSQQGILCWGFKGVQEEIPSEEASTLQIGSVAFSPGQCTSPQLHPCHRLFDQDWHQDSCSPSL